MCGLPQSGPLISWLLSLLRALSGASLDADLSAYRRVERLFELRVDERAAVEVKLPSLTEAYRAYAAEHRRLVDKLSASDWIDAATKGAKAAGGGKGAALGSAVTLEGLQAHTLGKR